MNNTNMIIDRIEFDHEEDWYEERLEDFRNEVIAKHVQVRRDNDARLKSLRKIMNDFDIRYDYLVIDGIEFDYPKDFYTTDSFADELRDKYRDAIEECDKKRIKKLKKIMIDEDLEFIMEECDE